MQHHAPEGPRDDLSSRTLYSRRRLLTLGVALATPAALFATLAGRDQRPSTEPIASTVVPPQSDPTATQTNAVSSTVAPTSAVPATVPATVPVLDHPLSLGMNGDDKIVALQDRLRAIAFDPGPADGYFGEATLRAVWAFEKLILGVSRDDVSGVVTESLWAALHATPSVTPRRPGIPGRHVEVYLPEQVAVTFADGSPVLITHISSGEGIEWCDEVTVDNDDGTETTKGICGVSITPGGVYHFERKIDGWRQAALGRLYNPVYFNYGIAIHGATNVPARPASRGCVRIPMHIAEYFPDLVSIGDFVFVFDGIEEPEVYGAQLPVFDRPDPSYTTTTTTTSSTTTSSTTPPTSVAPTSTTPPSAPATPATHAEHTTTSTSTSVTATTAPSATTAAVESTIAP